MKKNAIIRGIASLFLATLALGALIMGCSSAVGGSTAAATDLANAKSYSINVSWADQGTTAKASGAKALPTAGSVSSVTVLPYSQAGASILTDTTYALANYSLTNSGSVWQSTISVNALGPAVFVLTAYDTSSPPKVAYVGKATYTVPASGGALTITTGTASLTGGAIQGTGTQVAALSTYVNTFAGAPGGAGVRTFDRTDATFTSPRGITTDGTNFFVTDASEHRVKKIPIATGIVTVLAGTGTAGDATTTAASGAAAVFTLPSGITNDGTYLYVCSNNAIDRVSMADGTTVLYDGTPATGGTTDGSGLAATLFTTPLGITYFEGYLYVADTGSSNIRKVALGTGGGIASAGASLTYKGSASGWEGAAAGAPGIWASINVPAAITTDGINLYVANTGNGNIIQIKLDGSADAIFATGFTTPNGITTDGTYLYVTDGAAHQVKKILISNGTVSLVAGTGASTPANTDGLGSSATFNTPYGNIATDGKNLYVTDSANSSVRKIQ